MLQGDGYMELPLSSLSTRSAGSTRPKPQAAKKAPTSNNNAMAHTREQLAANIEALFQQYLIADKPQPSTKESLRKEEVMKKSEAIVASGVALEQHLPHWPKLAFQLLDDGLSSDEIINLISQSRNQNNAHPGAKALILPFGPSQRYSTKQLSMHCCHLLLPLLKPGFQAFRELSPHLNHKLWLFANVSILLGRHLSANKQVSSYQVAFTIACQFLGPITLGRLLAATLAEGKTRQPDAIALSYPLFERYSRNINHMAAELWHLPEEIRHTLDSNPNKDMGLNHPLSILVEQSNIAAKIHLLYNQNIVTEKRAIQWLSHWQLPLDLIKSFAPLQ